MKKIKLNYIIVVCIFIVFIGLVYKSVYFSHGSSTTISSHSFPNEINGWKAVNVNYDEDIIAVLEPDITVYKIYRKNNFRPITIFIAVYGSIEKSDLSHSPVVCFTGQGWNIYQHDTINVKVDNPDTPEIKVNRILQRKDEYRMVSLYWYQTPYKVYSNRGLQKLSLFFNRILGKSDKNAFVRVTIDVLKNDDMNKMEGQIQSFVKNLYPDLREFIH